MKKFLFTVLGIAAIHIAGAQDTLMLRNNSTIKAKVVEVGISEIKYKKFENPDGPTYAVKKSEVQMIKYQNGTTDVFQEKEKEIPTEKSSSMQPASSKKEKGTITLYFALSVPVGSFGNDQEGGAKFGWGLGLTGTSAHMAKNACFSYQVSYANHPYEQTLYDPYSGAKYTFKGDYNVWHVLAGIGVQTQTSPAIFYFNVMGGLNYSVLTGTYADLGYDDATAFAVSFGGGLVVGQNLNIGLKYINSNDTFKNSNSSAYDAEQKIGMFQFIIGYQF